MKSEITPLEITTGLLRQLKSFFSVSEEEASLIESLRDEVLKRCEMCFSKNKNKYYSKDAETYFSPYHSGQYRIFLYYFSNTIYKRKPESINLASKVYYLNKIMNSCDLLYEVELPEIFMLDHPVGSVLGRAKYGDYFSFGQNCTVGNNKGVFPKIGNNVQMTANTMIIGDCVGDNVILGAGTCIKDQNIPANSLVFGSSPNLIIKARNL